MSNFEFNIYNKVKSSNLEMLNFKLNDYSSAFLINIVKNAAIPHVTQRVRIGNGSAISATCGANTDITRELTFHTLNANATNNGWNMSELIKYASGNNAESPNLDTNTHTPISAGSAMTKSGAADKIVNT
jgi:hypothetical protein